MHLNSHLEKLDWIATDREFETFWREYGDDLEAHEELLPKVVAKLKDLGIYPWAMSE